MSVSIRRLAGYGVLAVPFAAIFAAAAWENGALFALSAFAGAAVLMGCLWLSVVLVTP